MISISFLEIIINSLINLIWIIELLLFVRAVLSWIPGTESSKFGQIIYKLTEPFISPFRELVSRSSVFNNIPIDISFLIAILVLEIARRFLQNI